MEKSRSKADEDGLSLSLTAAPTRDLNILSKFTFLLLFCAKIGLLDGRWPAQGLSDRYVHVPRVHPGKGRPRGAARKGAEHHWKRHHREFPNIFDFFPLIYLNRGTFWRKVRKTENWSYFFAKKLLPGGTDFEK